MTQGFYGTYNGQPVGILLAAITKFKPFERTFISLLLSFHNSARSHAEKEKKKKKASHIKFTLIAKLSVNLPGIPFQTNENPRD